MKLVKSLLLGSAAGLLAAAGVQAADLPARTVAPAAVDYVRVCSTYGAGFFYIPGSSDTCIRIGGRVRADVLYVEPFTRADNTLQLFARGRIQVDARTATSYGLLRTFVRFEMSRTGAADTSPNLAQAFIQWGGLTAGRVTSFFSNPDLPSFHMGTVRFDDSPDINLFAYTFNFGGGVSATLSVEEGQARRTTGFANASSVLTEGAVVLDPATGLPVFQNAYAVVPGGQTVPDIVGNIRAAGTWGSVQLSGALHQVRDVGATIMYTPPGGTTPVLSPRRNLLTGAPLPLFADTEYGWAVGASLGLSLPAFGPGDGFWVSAAYSSGAPSYSGFGSNVGLGTRSAGVVDAVVNPVTGDLELTDVWNVAAGFSHYWTPQLRSGVFGSYARVEYGGGASIVTPVGYTGAPAGTVLGLADFSEWRIGANTFWYPVSGLQLGVEVLYAQADYEGRVLEKVGGALLNQPILSGDIGAFEGRIRVQRDF